MEISGDDPKKIYRDEVKQGIGIFEKCFAARQNSQFDAQKAQYEKVMNEALRVIQDAATGLVNEQILKMKEKLDKDYREYLQHPSEQTVSEVNRDIQNIKDIN